MGNATDQEPHMDNITGFFPGQSPLIFLISCSSKKKKKKLFQTFLNMTEQ